METLDMIFNKLIQTPLIGEKEKQSITNSYNNLTSELDKFKMCKQIEYNYCTDEFLKFINLF